jgi:hypothetical protein
MTASSPNFLRINLAAFNSSFGWLDAARCSMSAAGFGHLQALIKFG